jgi:uncharacterized membrane protein
MVDGLYGINNGNIQYLCGIIIRYRSILLETFQERDSKFTFGEVDHHGNILSEGTEIPFEIAKNVWSSKLLVDLNLEGKEGDTVIFYIQI